MNPAFLITIDVEDWFQVENFKASIPFSSWPERELRVEKNIHRLLDLFDSIEPESSKSTSALASDRAKATFFFLGWIAERFPGLVREVHHRGHEVASHGYNHELPSRMSPANLKKDLVSAKKCLEDIVGVPVAGYRAPSFGIDSEVLKIIADSGYGYDSSYNSFSLHGRYGKVDLSGYPKSGLALKLSESFYELPVSNLEFKNRFRLQPSISACRKAVFPWGGGGYFRLIPFFLFKKGIRTILKNDGAYSFYMHPWEIDPNQPRVKDASRGYKFRHYVNLAGTEKKLFRMIQSFPNCRYVTCREYLRAVCPESFLCCL